MGGFLITITAIFPKTQLKTRSHEIHEETDPINQLLSLAHLYWTPLNNSSIPNIPLHCVHSPRHIKSLCTATDNSGS